MTGAAGFFPSSFGGNDAQPVQMNSDDAIVTAREQTPSEAGSPGAFDLIELHSRWFGKDDMTEPNATYPGNAASAPVERDEPVRASSRTTYRIIRNEHDARGNSQSPDQDNTGTQTPSRETIAQTLARAEQVLQQLPELPRHSRLEASLSALESALAGTTLSDLEAALAGNESPLGRDDS